MMRTITVLVVLLTAAPGFAQSRLYTNADLTAHPVTQWTQTVTPEQLAGLKAREFHLPTRPLPPDYRVVPHDPDWPFTTSTRDAIAVPFFTPWSMYAYVGRGYGGRFRQGDSRPALDHEPGSRGSAQQTPPLRPAR